MVLTSPKNPLLQETRRAIERGTLTEGGCAVAEGFHLLEEALRSDSAIETVLAAESVRETVERRVRGLRSVKVFVLKDELFRELSSTESAQGVIALIKPPRWTLEQVLRGQALLVILDGVQDPGNAGAIVRAAEAFGASGVVFLKGTVNVFNPKCLRASAGSWFRVPHAQGVNESLLLAAIEQRGIDLYAAAPAGEGSIAQMDLTRKCAVIIGGEGRGVSPKLRAAAIDLWIPTLAVESLNAAVAAGIILYEARRQRT